MAQTIEPSILIETALLTSPVALTVEDLSRLFDGRLDSDAITHELGRLAFFWMDRGLRLELTQSGWRFCRRGAAPSECGNGCGIK